MATVWNITANSVPDLDEWGLDDYWSCSDWINWHKAVAQAYGVQAANEKFLSEWNKQSFGAHALDCRSFNSAFREYTKSVGLHDALYDGALIAKPLGLTADTLTTVTNTASDVVQGAGSAVSGLAGGIGDFGKSLKYLIPIVLIVAIGVIGFTIYKRTQQITS